MTYKYQQPGHKGLLPISANVAMMGK